MWLWPMSRLALADKRSGDKTTLRFSFLPA